METIDRALRSVLVQTGQPSEIILIDDASGDETAVVLEQISKCNSRVRVITHHANKGVASARNTGWNDATQTYVAFLDSDASWHPRKLEIQYRIMELSSGAAVCGTQHLISPDDDQVQLPDAFDCRPVTFRDLLWSNRFITSSAMVHRTLPHRFKEGQRHMEDHRLWLEIAFTGPQIVRIELPLAKHHKADFGAGGLSGNLISMEVAELENYKHLANAGMINRLTQAGLTVWSLLKFLRRLAIVSLRTTTRRN